MAHTLGIIGAGNMGQAIVAGAIRIGVLEPKQILVAEVEPGRRQAVEALGCAVTDTPAGAAAAEQLMLATKPQSFPELAANIAPLARSTVVISIMAGLSSRRIAEALGEHARVVRVMPNIPCQVGQGMSSVALGHGAREGDDALTRRVFSAIGAVATVREDQMYAVTAVSGSGPAYVFLLAELMERAAIELGLEPRTARLLARQTVTGAGALLGHSAEEASVLRDAVTSKGGTTAAALDVMRRHDLSDIIVRAIAAARDRGIELDTM
jgi:pyrroline-5-carboxylate reductase